jgi:hypothetical protein
MRRIPDIKIAASRQQTLRIKLRHENAAHRGKPEFVHGIEGLRVIQGCASLRMSETRRIGLATRMPLDLTLGNGGMNEKGGCWEQ